MPSASWVGRGRLLTSYETTGRPPAPRQIALSPAADVRGTADPSVTSCRTARPATGTSYTGGSPTDRQTTPLRLDRTDKPYRCSLRCAHDRGRSIPLHVFRRQLRDDPPEFTALTHTRRAARRPNDRWPNTCRLYRGKDGHRPKSTSNARLRVLCAHGSCLVELHPQLGDVRWPPRVVSVGMASCTDLRG